MSFRHIENLRLKPCPCCGGLPHTSEYVATENFHKEYAIVCNNLDCILSIGASTAEEAVQRWNSRADKSELKACPFCGSKAELRLYDFDGRTMYQAQCTNLECEALNVRDVDKQGVIDRWNRRK